MTRKRGQKIDVFHKKSKSRPLPQWRHTRRLQLEKFWLAAALFVLTACSGEGYPPGAVAYVGRSESSLADVLLPKEGGADASEGERDVLVADAGDETLADVTMDVDNDVHSLDTGTDVGSDMRADIAADVSTDVRPDTIVDVVPDLQPDRSPVDSATDTRADAATDIAVDVVPVDMGPPPCVPADCEDRSPCTRDTCTAGVCSHNPYMSGTVCPAGVCDGASMPRCVECLDSSRCAATHRCEANRCVPWFPRVAYTFTSTAPGGGAITGFYARVVDLQVAPGANIVTPDMGGERGTWRFNPCVGGVRVGPPVSCPEINVAALLPSGRAWESEYAIEIDAMVSSAPLCGTDGSCRGCWSAATWGCGTATCVAGGELPRNNVVPDAMNYPGGPQFTVFRLQPQGIPGARRAPCMPPR